MCGRYTYRFTWKQLHRLMGLTTPLEFPPRYNVAPTQFAPIVRMDGGERRLEAFRWGLVPSWAKDVSIGNRTINARSETVATTPAFRAAFRKRRCLVPVSGFYEWERLADGKSKQTWYFTREDDDPFVLAGLWETWAGGEGGTPIQPLHTFTILTTRANAVLKPIHERMPVILAPDQFDTWLDPAVESAERLMPLLDPSPPKGMKAQRVSTWVNSPAHEDARCMEPVETPPSQDDSGSLFNFR